MSDAKVYFSPKMRFGFHHEGDEIPNDAVEIDYGYFLTLLKGQHTKNIAADENGYPVLVDMGIDKATMLSNELRTRRDIELKMSDWTQLPDVPASQKRRYAVYRQQLRDIPSQEGFPFDVDWPKKP